MVVHYFFQHVISANFLKDGVSQSILIFLLENLLRISLFWDTKQSTCSVGFGVVIEKIKLLLRLLFVYLLTLV